MATITNVQSAKYGSSASASVIVSWTITPTSGNLLIARTRNLGGSGTEKGAITGWTLIEYALYGTGNRYVSIFCKIAGASEGDVTYTSTSSTETYLIIEEWSNSAGWNATPQDQYINVDTTGSTVTSRSTGTTGTTTVTDELAVSVLGTGNTVTGISWSNSFTASFEQPTGSLTFAGAHKILSTTGTVETTASWTTARVAGAAIATFKGNAGTAYNQSTDGTLTVAGVIIRIAEKLPAGTLTTAGAVNKASTKTFTGEATTSGGLAKTAAKLFTGTVTSVGEVVKSVVKMLSGTLTTNGVISKAIGKVVSGTLSFIGTFASEENEGITGYGNLEIIKAAKLQTIYPVSLENIKAARNATISAQAIETIKAPRIQNIDR